MLINYNVTLIRHTTRSAITLLVEGYSTEDAKDAAERALNEEEYSLAWVATEAVMVNLLHSSREKPGEGQWTENI